MINRRKRSNKVVYHWKFQGFLSGYSQKQKCPHFTSTVFPLSLLHVYQQLIRGSCFSDKHSFCWIKKNQKTTDQFYSHAIPTNKNTGRCKTFHFYIYSKTSSHAVLKAHFLLFAMAKCLARGSNCKNVLTILGKKPCFETEGHSQVISPKSCFLD